MPHDLLARCPVCQGELRVTALACARCQTTIHGDFDAGAFARLTSAQRQFTMSFLKCRGNIREMEKEYSISYPTVRARIDEIVAAIGEHGSPAVCWDDVSDGMAFEISCALEPSGASVANDVEETGSPCTRLSTTKRDILNMLSEGKIDALEAQRMIEELQAKERQEGQPNPLEKAISIKDTKENADNTKDAKDAKDAIDAKDTKENADDAKEDVDNVKDAKDVKENANGAKNATDATQGEGEGEGETETKGGSHDTV